MMKVLVGYPSEEEEFVIVERVIGDWPMVQPVLGSEELSALQHACRRVFVEPALIQYAVRVVAATRAPGRHGLAELGPHVAFGASPRASIHLIEGARALALLRGRDYVLPEDVAELVPDVLRHRLVLSYQALAEGVTADQLIATLAGRLRPPAKPLAGRGWAASGAIVAPGAAAAASGAPLQ
jgi:MoxR-like ATPase